MLSLSLFNYTDDVMAARDRPNRFFGHYAIPAWPRESCPSRASQSGNRAGNWLTREQARRLPARPDTDTIEGKRDRAIVVLGNSIYERLATAPPGFSIQHIRLARLLRGAVISRDPSRSCVGDSDSLSKRSRRSGLHSTRQPVDSTAISFWWSAFPHILSRILNRHYEALTQRLEGDLELFRPGVVIWIQHTADDCFPHAKPARQLAVADALFSHG